MKRLDKENDLIRSWLLEIKPGHELWDISIAINKLMNYTEYYRDEINRRQDTIYKLRAENKKLRRKVTNPEK